MKIPARNSPAALFMAASRKRAGKTDLAHSTPQTAHLSSGLFSKRTCEMNPTDLITIPSGASSYMMLTLANKLEN